MAGPSSERGSGHPHAMKVLVQYQLRQRAATVEPRLKGIAFSAATRRAVPVSGRVENRVAVQFDAETRGAQISAERFPFDVHPDLSRLVKWQMSEKHHRKAKKGE